MIKFSYMRDSENRPLACVCFESSNGVVNYGVSFWNPKDKFDKRVAREVAYGRLQKHPGNYTFENTWSFNSLFSFIVNNEKVPARLKRAVKSYAKSKTLA
jgi:hypothetical protein